jgi:hypothetical protein
LTFEHSSSFDICLNDDLSSHNEDKDEDRNINSPFDQLDDNVGTYQEFAQCFLSSIVSSTFLTS